MIAELTAAVALGFGGSLHCAAMCGPLALAGASSRPRADAGGYLLGRLVSYAFAGAMFGALGHAVHGTLEALQGIVWPALAGLAFAHGVRLLVRASSRTTPLVQLRPRRAGWGGLAFAAELLPKRGLGLGLATAALPCGLSMGGFLIAASSESSLVGALAMAAFATATAPALAAPLFLGPALPRLLARAPASVPGLLWCSLGLWIAARPWLMAAHGAHGCG
jgi:sulfite exporter TauE/SafE